MPTPTNEQVLDALAQIQDPDLGRDVVSLGMIKELTVDPAGRVSFTFELTTPACPVRDRFKSQAQDAVGGLPGVTAVEVRRSCPASSRRSRSRQARAASASRRWP